MEASSVAQSAAADPDLIVPKLSADLENQNKSSLEAILQYAAACENLLNSASPQTAIPGDSWAKEYGDDIGSIFSTNGAFVIFGHNDPSTVLKTCVVATRSDADLASVVGALAKKHQVAPRRIAEKDRPNPELEWLIDDDKLKYFVGPTVNPKSGLGIFVAKKK